MQPYVFIDEVPLEPLDKISGVNVNPGIDFVDISWNHHDDIDHYALTVNGETYIQMDNSITITNLTPDTDYSLRLISVAGELQSPAYIDHFKTLPEPIVELTVPEPPITPIPIDEPVLRPIHLWGISGGILLLLLIIFLVLLLWDNSPRPQVPGLHNIL